MKTAPHLLTGELQVMLAAYHGHAPLVKLLMQHGADPNILNDRRQSPLAGAVFKNEPEVVEVGHRPKQSVSKSDRIWQALLEGGADPDYGSPSAMETVTLFKQEEKWKGKFESAPGRGKAAST